MIKLPLQYTPKSTMNKIYFTKFPHKPNTEVSVVYISIRTYINKFNIISIRHHPF